jgi:peptide/nickel transport system substrate-binding protein
MKRMLGKLLSVFSKLGVLLLLLTSSAAARSGGVNVSLPLIMRYFPQERTLTICLGEEPGTLYLHGGRTAARHQILEAIYDGPVDSNSFASQAVVLAKLPSLKDGDARVEAVSVQQGDTVVDSQLDVVRLEPGVMVIPTGQTEAVEYTGGSIQMDQLVVDYKLKSGLKWSDGEPLTAHDSVYAFNLIGSPDTPATSALKFGFERTASYVALNDLTVRLTTLPGLINIAFDQAFISPLPEHAWGSYTPKELLTAPISSRTPIGWGPFTISEWVSGDHILLHKNPHYWRANESLPRIENLIFRFTGNDGEANLTALLAGECDILAPSTGIGSDPERLLELDGEGLLQALFSTGTIWRQVTFGIQHVSYDDGYDGGTADRPNFFGDVRTRLAFAACMDRQGIMETATYGQSVVLDTYLSPLHPLFNQSAPGYEFDPAAGSALLGEVGWSDHDSNSSTPRLASGVAGVPDGTPLSVTLGGDDSSISRQIADLLKHSLAQCGIDLTVTLSRPVTWSESGPGGKFFGRQFELGLYSWLTGVRPPCGLYTTSQVPGPANETWTSILSGEGYEFSRDWNGSNTSGYANPAYDQRCSQALNHVLGTSEYLAGQKEAQALFAGELPAVPLYLNILSMAARPNLSGVELDPTAGSEFWNIEEFRIGP